MLLWDSWCKKIPQAKQGFVVSLIDHHTNEPDILGQQQLLTINDVRKMNYKCSHQHYYT